MSVSVSATVVVLFARRSVNTREHRHNSQPSSPPFLVLSRPPLSFPPPNPNLVPVIAEQKERYQARPEANRLVQFRVRTLACWEKAATNSTLPPLSFPLPPSPCTSTLPALSLLHNPNRSTYSLLEVTSVVQNQVANLGRLWVTVVTRR